MNLTQAFASGYTFALLMAIIILLMALPTLLAKTKYAK